MGGWFERTFQSETRCKVRRSTDVKLSVLVTRPGPVSLYSSVHCKPLSVPSNTALVADDRGPSDETKRAGPSWAVTSDPLKLAAHGTPLRGRTSFCPNMNPVSESPFGPYAKSHRSNESPTAMRS